MPPLEALHAAGFDISLVVTGADRRRGRGNDRNPTPVKAAAERLGVSQQAVGLIERPERIILLGFGLLAGELAGNPAIWTTGTLALLALLGNLTVAQRLVHFWRNASET